MKKETSNITTLDQAHIWHPLTQHKTSSLPVPIIKAEGAILYGEDRKEYIDGISSWYTTIYGHSHPYIVKAVKEQMETLDFTMFSGFTHPAATSLAEKLLPLLPDNQKKIFFNDNGSTAVEAAIKMAFQFHHNKGDHRDTIIALEDGFHGDTFGAMSASGISSYNAPFENFLLKVVRIPTPQIDNLNEVKSTLLEILSTHNCASFISEPLVQGAAGMKFHYAQGLSELIAMCQERNVICIADEIMTGFGKTGTHFASDQLSCKPDIMCLSKALTAGMFPLSVTSCSQEIFDGFLSDEVSKGFFHAHTFSAHPLGCAAASAGIELMLSDEMRQHARRVNERHSAFAKAVSSHPKAQNVRVKGIILALELATEMERYGNLRYQLYQFFMDRGVCLRPLGNTIYALPPLVTTDEQLEKIYTTIVEALETF